jgi:hypothetical protein
MNDHDEQGMNSVFIGSSMSRPVEWRAVSRMMQTFQQGMLTLERVRSKGKQTVVVQHQ